jgi:hypothetical protein
MLNKILKAILSVILAVAMCFVTCTAAFAATSNKKTYIKEVFLSYGESDNDAKSYLKDNGYEVLDYNLNEGADDSFSDERAVYLGYKTTSNADEAITDMKLMNMKGGYSVEDYQLMLEEQKSTIKFFIDNFIFAINEYRENYKKRQERAIVAHDLLNLLYDNDTNQNLGDLFLDKIREEYTDEEFNALSADEQAKTADMTTILMQANGTAVLTIEQIVALATDDENTVWIERYDNAKSYDEMVEELVENKGITASEAAKQLSAEYDEDAKAIASKFEDYKDYLKTYTDETVKFTSTEEEIEAYKENKESEEIAEWAAAGTQCEALSLLKNEDISLLDLVTSDEYELENDDSYLLYPLVSVLTKGQRACLDFLPMYQIVSLGINNDDSVKKALEKVKIDSLDEGVVSIYDGVDRSVFTNEVAMTGEAYNLQNSSDKDASDNWFTGGVSTAAKVMYLAFGVTTVATVASFVASNFFAKSSESVISTRDTLVAIDDMNDEIVDGLYAMTGDTETDLESAAINSKVGEARAWSKVFNYAGIAMAAISIILLTISVWKTYTDLKAYYNTELTPIPMHMVNQGVDENDEKVFTYYTAVNCNREDANMVTDRTSVLENFGDINGDVGKEWVALYTTKDKSAGNPITADFVVQYGSSNIPGDDTPLSMFGESVAQNLTNEKAGYTYSNDKGGIYLFYATDNTALAGSVFSGSTYVLIGVGCIIVLAIVTFCICRGIKKKKGKEIENNAQ